MPGVMSSRGAPHLSQSSRPGSFSAPQAVQGTLGTMPARAPLQAPHCMQA